MKTLGMDRGGSLEACVARSVDAPGRGVDTEFVRDRTYFPRAGLIQIATPEEIALVDPVRLGNLDPLARLLFESEAAKILHAGRQDLELFTVLFDRVPAPLFDTQKAAALVGLAPQIGYAALAETLLGATPGVALGRYDWLARPLADRALGYAAEDVAHLEPMRAILARRLESAGRLAEFDADMRADAGVERYRPHPGEAWQRIRSKHRLDGAALVRLKALARWREQRAMTENRPRQWILRDKALVVLARLAPRTETELARIRLLPPATRRRYGRMLLDLVAASGA